MTLLRRMITEILNIDYDDGKQAWIPRLSLPSDSIGGPWNDRKGVVGRGKPFGRDCRTLLRPPEADRKDGELVSGDPLEE